MRAAERIRAEVLGTLRGDPWHGSSVEKILAGVDARAAAARPIAGAHTIWELVLHMTAWTRAVERRLRGGEAVPPVEGDWPPVGRSDPAAWAAALADLRAAHEELARTLAGLDDSALERQIAGGQVDALGEPVTGWRTAIGLPQHDAYHSGQIALLKKLA